MKQYGKKEEKETGLEVAVIGMAGRFPGAKNVHEFWDNLKNGIESITFFSDEELLEVGVDPMLLENPNYVKGCGILSDIEYFDAAFFGYFPKEAEIMDPQVRIFHECTWTALEDAGYDPLGYKGLIGLYAGAAPNLGWQARVLLSGKSHNFGDFAASQLTQKEYLNMRVSYKLNLSGPSLFLYTTCSTSLVAIHLGYQALLNGECDIALAGGVTAVRLVRAGYMYEEGMMSSPDGHCRAFDESAKGMVGADGVGVVVLRRLRDAVSEGDHIYAIIKGSAINNDGMQRAGFSAPSVKGQAEVIKMAMQMAGVEPESISYVETHGTGTELGDPIEIEGLKLASNTSKKGFCGIGSVKTNLGHVDAAAGVAGFIKTVIALNHRLIPPSLHFETPNPGIDFIDSPFYVNSTLTPWENNGHPLRAGVSSFGQGGTNAHVILEEFVGAALRGCPALGVCDQEHAVEGMGHLIVLSAKTLSALNKITQNLVQHFREIPFHPADTAFTLLVGRHAFKFRKMCVCSSIQEAVEILETPGSDKAHSFAVQEENRPVVFLFPGEEGEEGFQAQNKNIEEKLYRHNLVFRKEMDRCLGILKSQPPARFIFNYALAKMLMECGIKPYAAIGESSGETAAKCLSGEVSLENALKSMAPATELNTLNPMALSFSDRLKQLAKLENPIFVYFGSHIEKIEEVLAGVGDFSGHLVHLLRPLQEESSDLDFLMTQIGCLWLYGVNIDWERFYSGERRYRIALPTYPFEGQRYWIGGDTLKLGDSLFSKKGLEKIQDTTAWFYVPTWARSLLPIGKESSQKQSRWLLFLNNVPLGEHLVQRLKKENHKVVIVRPGAGYLAINFHEYTVDPQDTNSYVLLFKELSKFGNVPDNILHCWCITAGNENRLTLGTIDQAQDLGLYSLLNIAQAIGKNSISHEIQLGVITSSMQPVTGEEALCPEKATILGPVKVIPLEYTNVCCRSIDIIDTGPDVHKIDFLASQILREFSEDFSKQLAVAYRGIYRWKESYEPIRLNGKSQKDWRFKEKGVYLITGGLGGMGFTIAENLAQKLKAKLILIDILDFPPRDQWDEWLARDDKQGEGFRQQIRKIREMENLGAEIYIHHVDVSNYKRMKEAIAKSEERFGKINGVVHSAGLIDYAGVIHRRTREMTEELLAAKVKGTLIINELLVNNKLDFMVLFSSIGNLLYKLKFGQVGYNAGHEFLGSFAYHKQKQGTFTVTIDWCDWSEVGMAVKAAEAANLSTDISDNILTISPSEGIQVFDRILENDLSHVIISSRDLGEIVKYIDSSNSKNGESDTINSADDDHSDTFYERPEFNTSYTPPENETQEVLVNIWQRFFGIKPVGIDDDFFELGGDSLKIITVIARIQKEIGIQVPIPEFFNTPTIKGLAIYISGNEEKEIPHVLMGVEPTEEKEFYPLSSAQKRVYIMQEMQPDSFGYNMPGMVILEGECNKNRLGTIFRKLIERHESLRTSFMIVNNAPVQRVHKAVDFEIDYYNPEKGDMGSGNLTLERDKIDKMVKAFVRAFDLSEAPLLRVGLIKIAEVKHLLMVDMHHIISDGISMDIFVREFITLMVGKELPLLKLQFKDYSVWQSNPEVKLALKHQEDYWLKEFSGDIPELNMPFDYERSSYQSFEGSWVNFEITEKETTDIKELAREENATLFMVLIALYSVLLSKLSGQEDIIIGTGIAGRRYPDIEPLIGMFVNTLAIRTYSCKEKTFKVLLTEIREKALLAFENQDYQFEDMVEKVLVSRKRNRNPLFDVALVLQNQRSEKGIDDIYETGSLELKFRAYNYDNQASKFDMVLFCDEFQGKLKFTIEYCTKLFKEKTIERFIDYFKQIVASVIDNKDIKLKDITISHHFLRARMDNPGMELEF